jgi:hypothetical protein
MRKKRWVSCWAFSFATVTIGLAPSLVFATSGAANVCPNETVRKELNSTLLPDCRAYELVGPAAKNGWLVTVMSADGSHVILKSVGGFAGSTQTSLLQFYDARRSLSGWITSPFSEPSGLSNSLATVFLAGSFDLGEGVFSYRASSTSTPYEQNLYMRALPEGPPVEVGPELPHAAVANPTSEEPGTNSPSASSRLTSILFAIAGPSSLLRGDYLWPGDTTAENTGPLYGSQGFTSWYEYKGTGNSTPTLVGVGNNGALVSQCGTALGFPSEGIFSRIYAEEIDNAISADGSLVFFTAAAANQGPGHDACTGAGQGTGPPADELFARVNENETVSISEPSAMDCSTCQTGEPAEAVFQGASEDGSKVFFLTSQPLLPADHDNTNDLYEYDFAAPTGERVLQVSAGGAGDAAPGTGAAVQGTARISEDGSHVYFVAQGILTTSPSPAGDTARAGADNLYVFDTDTKQTAFIGDLCSGSQTSGAVSDTRCPPGASDVEDWQREDVRPVDTTPDGRSLVFISAADLTLGDTSTEPQVFEYDAQLKTLVRISVGQDGFNDNGNTSQYAAGIVAPSYNGSQDPAPQLTSISDDGSIVAFQSPDALTPQAAAGYVNVYEYHSGQVSLISDGQDRTSGQGGVPSTSLVGMDGSGADIFLTTADQLVPQDGDTQLDVYDARVEGGFPPSPSPPECEGEGCQGALSPAPLLPAIGSVGQLEGEQVFEGPVKPASKAKAERKRKKTKLKRKKAKASQRRSGKAGGRRR